MSDTVFIEAMCGGSWRWFAKCPDNLIENQRSLVEYIDGKF